ncbi:hypothetical protein [Streptacidiphilus melanogenes]|uniref:hypothetical protein n=1 Tax=Streptacidiphilus melanogenes TaxID=411235 RepID=UPI0005A9987D|nr:hypothetical protein [Streptacidiphilus melanogenes]
MSEPDGRFPAHAAEQVEALAALPVARACGVTPALAADVRTVASGGVPRLRLAVAGWASGARKLRDRAAARLPAGSVGWAAGAVDAHLLWYVVPDPRQDAGPNPPGLRLTSLLAGPGAPATVLVVAADDDWRGLGLDSVAGWCLGRTASWPAPWPTVPVRAVIPAWFADRPTQSGLTPLLRDVLDRCTWRTNPAAADLTADQAVAANAGASAHDGTEEPLTVRLTRLRLVSALRLLLLRAAVPAQADSARPTRPHPAQASRPNGQPGTLPEAVAEVLAETRVATPTDTTPDASNDTPRGAPADGPATLPNPAEAWRRCHTFAALAPARRLHRRLVTTAERPSPTTSADPARQTSPQTERP